jgi:toxin-antitoxin system PIN domain toxin
MRAWLEGALGADEPVGLADPVLAGFVRVSTHPRVFTRPAPIGRALGFVDSMLDAPSALHVFPGERHWPIFRRLCVDARARGNLVADAYLAAIAIEQGGVWITRDRDFSRFAPLRWRDALA